MSAIHVAICGMLSEVEHIEKNKKNVSQGFMFRGIDDIYNSIHPLFSKHKVFPTCEIVKFETETGVNSKGNTVYQAKIHARYMFYAEDGSYVPTEVIGIGVDQGDKHGNKAMSVAYKYAILQLLCIPTEAVDPDIDSDDFVKKLPSDIGATPDRRNIKPPVSPAAENNTSSDVFNKAKAHFAKIGIEAIPDCISKVFVRYNELSLTSGQSHELFKDLADKGRIPFANGVLDFYRKASEPQKKQLSTMIMKFKEFVSDVPEAESVIANIATAIEGEGF